MIYYQFYIVAYFIFNVAAGISTNMTTNTSTTFVLDQSLQTRCCYVTPIGVECPNQLNRSSVYNVITDSYAGLELYQTFLLVASNVPLFFVALQTYSLCDYTRTFLLTGAALVSSLFHLCKTRLGVGICLLPFCTLRALDYAFSNTVLVSTILFLFPIVLYSHDTVSIRGKENMTMESKNHRIDQINQKYTKSLRKLRFIESYILVGFFAMVYFSVSGPLLCNGNFMINFLVVIFITALMIGLVGSAILYYCNNIKIVMNTKYIFIGLLFGMAAIIPFIVEGSLDVSSYWITHSLWHLLAAPALWFVFNSRTQTLDGDLKASRSCYSCGRPSLHL